MKGILLNEGGIDQEYKEDKLFWLTDNTKQHYYFGVVYTAKTVSARESTFNIIFKIKKRMIFLKVSRFHSLMNVYIEGVVCGMRRKLQWVRKCCPSFISLSIFAQSLYLYKNVLVVMNVDNKSILITKPNWKRRPQPLLSLDGLS